MYRYFDGFGKEFITLPYKTKENLIGKPITIKGDGSIDMCIDGEGIFGVIEDQNRNYITVQLDGYVELPTAETESLVGYKSLSSDGNGGVKADENGIFTWVLRHDTQNGIVGMLLS